jgi:histidinol-phosphate/aromatic aminotransferase/cobyric acid decarboxylase-like protein
LIFAHKRNGCLVAVAAAAEAAATTAATAETVATAAEAAATEAIATAAEAAAGVFKTVKAAFALVRTTPGTTSPSIKAHLISKSVAVCLKLEPVGRCGEVFKATGR